jgi:2,3-dihydroxybenzoate-AMP ligase
MRVTTLSSLILERARCQAQDMSIIGPSRRISYGELLEVGSRIANGLLASGLQSGDRALLVFRGSPSFAEAYVGCVFAGIVPVPFYPSIGWGQLLDLGERTAAKALLCDNSEQTLATCAAVLDSLPLLNLTLCFGATETTGRFESVGEWSAKFSAELSRIPEDPDAPLVILLSSGTTGRPKLIERTHRQFALASQCFARNWGCKRGVRFGILSLATHAAGLGWGLQAGLIGGATVIIPEDRRPSEAFPFFIEQETDCVFLVPSQGRALLTHLESHRALQPQKLKRLIFGGEILDARLARGLTEHWNVEIQNTYGMSEGFCTATATAASGLEEILAGSVGRPCFCGDVAKIVNDLGLLAPDGEVGELWVRGPTTIRRYWDGNDDDSFSPDGFLKTGDLFRREGRSLAFVGRKRLLINRGGIKISPELLEQKIASHDAIEGVVVSGWEDPQVGERVCAAVQTCESAPALTLQEIKRFLTDHGVGSAYHPDRLIFLDALPRNDIGKIERNFVRAAVNNANKKLEGSKH